MLTQRGDEVQEEKPCLFVASTLRGRGGSYFVSLMVPTAKHIKISVKIAGYGVLGESEQSADQNENFFFFLVKLYTSWQPGDRNASLQ